ncbi:hypothetical protein Q1695_000726 [Nippostrongylus brasiliensis]|nr:hypothetical protein Q1695_000726 [Nippostrongylus brasiliensis]
MKLFHVLICAGLFYLTESLRQVRIGAVSHSASVRNQDFVEDEDPGRSLPNSIERPVHRRRAPLNDASSPFVQEEGPSASGEDVRIVPKPRKHKKAKKSKRLKKPKMRKVKVRPRSGRHIKDTYQNLRSVQYVDESKAVHATTERVVTLEPIYDTTSKDMYSQEELLKLCEETKSIGQKFGITNVSSFAGSNCALIRLYYPEVTCEQINVFIQYCHSAGTIE